MIQPICLESQRDTEGVGYKAGLFEPWWDDLYDKAAAKLRVIDSNQDRSTERQSKKDKSKQRSRTENSRLNKHDEKMIKKRSKSKVIKSKSKRNKNLNIA